MRSLAALALAFGLAVGVSAQSFTVATFSDPAPDATTPLFAFDMLNNTLSGSWTSTNLLLNHPGFIGGGSSADVTFVMNPVTLTNITSNVYQMGAGQVDFFDSSNVNIFTITFTGGLFVNPFSASSADIMGFNVSFIGPNVPGGLSNEQFSFSLANATQQGNVMTYTSAFTSSAVPEPATMVALGSGLALLAARRRNRR